MTRPGRDLDGEAKTELDHFGNCPVCGAFVDMRDLAQVMAHAHGQEAEEVDAPAFDSRENTADANRRR
jgi:hypothetical protein